MCLPRHGLALTDDVDVAVADRRLIVERVQPILIVVVNSGANGVVGGGVPGSSLPSVEDLAPTAE
jgi:hypothetical protein